MTMPIPFALPTTRVIQSGNEAACFLTCLTLTPSFSSHTAYHEDITQLSDQQLEESLSLVSLAVFWGRCTCSYFLRPQVENALLDIIGVSDQPTPSVPKADDLFR